MSDERAWFLEEKSEERIEQDFLAGEIATWLRAIYPEPPAQASTGFLIQHPRLFPPEGPWTTPTAPPLKIVIWRQIRPKILWKWPL